MTATRAMVLSKNCQDNLALDSGQCTQRARVKRSNKTATQHHTCRRTGLYRFHAGLDFRST